MAFYDVDNAMTVKLDYDLPPYPTFREGIRRAPRREAHLSQADKALAIRNALRYIHPDHHLQMAREFARELEEHGRIYGYRFRPEGALHGKPIDQYRGNFIEAKAFQVMMDNNLDFDVALYPYELVTYGETGQVCQNWMQYRLIKKYLEVMTDEQTLVVMSGHPLGLFHSHKLAPRCIITNGLMVGTFDDQKNFNRAAALGVANYGQMTAGGWMYIGPQGIVHGTFNTLLNAGRLKLGIPADGNLAGRLFVSAGLGGMSGAQGKAAEIAGAVSIIAEVDDSRIETRYTQGWVSQRTDSLEEALAMARRHLADRTPCAIAYHGNVVDLLEYLYKNDVHVDLLSDQTSCHVPYDGGYCPQGLTFAQRTELLDHDPEKFRKLVDKSLRRHYEMICKFHDRGTYFFDYGNSFLKAVFDAGVRDVCRNGENDLDGFVFPSYVEDILGPCLFDFGYGPFRWCCLSGKPEDLDKTDAAAAAYILENNRRYQDYDNYVWVRDAKRNRMVVGTQCRHGTHEHRPEIQRDGAKRRDRPRDAGPGPPRHRRNGLPLPGDLQHQGRLQHHGGHGHPVLCRQRRPGHEPHRPAQRRRRGHRQVHQRRVRHGAGRLGAGGHHPAYEYALGHHGGCGPAQLGPERQRRHHGHGV